MTREEFLKELDLLRYKLNVTIAVPGETRFFYKYLDELDCLVHSFRHEESCRMLVKSCIKGTYK